MLATARQQLLHELRAERGRVTAVFPRDQTIEQPLIDLEAVVLGARESLDRGVALRGQAAADRRIGAIERLLPLPLPVRRLPLGVALRLALQVEILGMLANRGADEPEQREKAPGRDDEAEQREDSGAAMEERLRDARDDRKPRARREQRQVPSPENGGDGPDSRGIHGRSETVRDAHERGGSGKPGQHGHQREPTHRIGRGPSAQQRGRAE